MAQYKVELTGCKSFARRKWHFIKGQPKIMNLSERDYTYLKSQRVFRLLPQKAKAVAAPAPKVEPEISSYSPPDPPKDVPIIPELDEHEVVSVKKKKKSSKKKKG